MSTPDILTRIKQEESFAGGGHFPEERGIPSDPCGGDAMNHWIGLQEGGCSGNPVLNSFCIWRCQGWSSFAFFVLLFVWLPDICLAKRHFAKKFLGASLVGNYWELCKISAEPWWAPETWKLHLPARDPLVRSQADRSSRLTGSSPVAKHLSVLLPHMDGLMTVIKVLLLLLFFFPRFRGSHFCPRLFILD